MLRLFIKFYVILFISIFLYLIFRLVSQNTWLNNELEADRYNDLIGTIFLLDTLYQSKSDDEFRRAMFAYPKESNIPIELFSQSELDLSEEDNNRLEKGELLTNRDMATYDEPKNIILYHLLPDSKFVVAVGPLGREEKLDTIVKSYERSILLVIAFPLFIIMINLYSKLRRLEKASISIGKGDFSTRVSEKNNHTIGKLNYSFNQMAERVERLIEGHKQLTNAVAHELRTPVTRIRFELDMMQLEKNESIRNEYMYGVSDDINELADLVDELLTYARFDRETSTIELGAHSLHNSLCNIVKARLFDSQKESVYDDSWIQDTRNGEQIYFEPKHLERAIGNLVSNAEKYSKSKVRISVERQNNYCRIYVDDDGPGIPEQDRIDIFSPFKRLDNSRTRATGGFGLGLAIVKQIAQWHGGDVSIEVSQLGGARFIFSWPT